MRKLDPRVTLLAAVAVFGLLPSSARALPLVFNNSTGTQYFKATIAASGSLSLSANVNFQLSTGGLLGFTIGGGVNIPNQNLPLNLVGGPLNVNVVPTGSGTMTLGNQQFGPVDPGTDGQPSSYSALFPGGLPSVLTDADLTALQVTLAQNIGIPIDNGPLNVSGTTSINTILGDINLDTEIQATLNAALQNIAYQQDPNTDFLVGSGTRVNPGFGGNQSTNYFAGAPGDITAALNASLDADANISILFGLVDIPLSLGSFNLSESINEQLALAGFASLEDLNPGDWDQTNYDNMRFTLNDGGILSLIPLNFDINTSAVLPLTFQTSTSLLGVNFDITGAGSATIAANISFGVTGAAFQVQDTIEGVVIPEPSSIALCVLGLACMVPVIRRRVRKG